MADQTLPSADMLSVADIRAKAIEASSLDDEDFDKLELFKEFQLAGDSWVAGAVVPGNDSLFIMALFDGENDRSPGVTGDIRVYIIPRTVVQPGAKEYRRVILSEAIPKMKSWVMNFDAFIEALADEYDALALRLGVIEEEDPDDDPEEIPEMGTAVTANAQVAS